eukprot:366775-Pelagomonas_calceolata.AAC.7
MLSKTWPARLYATLHLFVPQQAPQLGQAMRKIMDRAVSSDGIQAFQEDKHASILPHLFVPQQAPELGQAIIRGHGLGCVIRLRDASFPCDRTSTPLFYPTCSSTGPPAWTGHHRRSWIGRRPWIGCVC